MKRSVILIIIMLIFGLEQSVAQKNQFKENLNTAVFTTKFVLKQKRTITYVTHDAEDGAWQFFSNDSFNNFEEVAAIASLEQIVKIDKTILEISDLPLGYIATRKNLKDKWKIEKAE